MVRPSASQEPDPRSRAGLLSLQEAADRLEVHYMTAYRYVRTGRLRAVQIGSQWWVDPQDLAGAGDGQAVAGRPAGDTAVLAAGCREPARGQARGRRRARGVGDHRGTTGFGFLA